MTVHFPVNILFLCTHNSARSLMAEALLNDIGAGRFHAFSAGSSPRAGEQPHPLTLEVLDSAGIATHGLRSKGWDEFLLPDAPRMDLIITVCDNAANETCPVWPGHPALAHWGLPDPALVAGGHEQRLDAFKQTLHRLHQRLELLLSLPLAGLDRLLLEGRARELGAHP